MGGRHVRCDKCGGQQTDSLQSVLSLHHMASRDRAQVIRLSSKHLDPAEPSCQLKKLFFSIAST